MEFTSIKWEGGSAADPRTVLSDKRSTWYECTMCDEKWDDARRDQAVADGEWRDRDEGLRLDRYLASRRPVIIGFHYRAWISRFVPLREAAAAFLRGEKDTTKLKDFQNDYNAEPWRVYRQDRKSETIMALIEDRPRGLVPVDAAYLTAGVDTQDDGFWFWIHAWGFAEPGQRPPGWCIRAGFVIDFPGLEQVLFTDQYLDVEEKTYPIRAAFQDAGGHRTHEVYDFCRAHPARIFPSFGKRILANPHRWGKTNRLPGSRQLMPGDLRKLEVNTKFFKDAIAQALQVAAGDPGGISLYADFPKGYAEQLVVEYIGDDGFWECPPGRDNHLLDCLVLNFAAADIIGPSHRVPSTTPEVKARPQPPKIERPKLW
jgi:phage terminase large subunit GpA-like protein